MKNGQLAEGASVAWPDLSALVARQQQQTDGLKLKLVADFAPGGDHAWRPHVNEEDTPRTKAQNDPRAHAFAATNAGGGTAAVQVCIAGRLAHAAPVQGRQSGPRHGRVEADVCRYYWKPRRQGKVETMTMERFAGPSRPACTKGRQPIDLPRSSNSLMICRSWKKGLISARPSTVVTELPLQKIKKEPPSGPVLLKAKTQSGEKIEVYEGVIS